MGVGSFQLQGPEASLIGELRPERREVIVAHEIDGTAMSEIARMHHIPINTAYNRLRLGRQDLRVAWHRRVL